MGFTSWGFEIMALVGTVGIGGAMVGLLARFDGNPVVEWYSITLNAIISTLSAVMKALLLFSAAECIGQWKWILLRRSKRSLIDFERVDLASRGPLGCFDLVWRRQTPLLLRLGLITVILTVAVDPFSQQLLQLQRGVVFSNHFQYDPYATSSRASFYYGGEQIRDDDNSTSLGKGRHTSSLDGELRSTRLDFSMEAAILNSFAQSNDVIKQQSPTTCPTGNCTWSMFPTLGVCHRCKNLTSELERVVHFGDFFNMLWGDDGDEAPSHRVADEDATAFVLPNGHFMANVNGCSGEFLSCLPDSADYTAPDDQDSYALTAYSTGNWNRTVSMQDVDTLIRSMSVIYLDGKKLGSEKAKMSFDDLDKKKNLSSWPNAPVAATECAVYFCIKEVETEMNGNKLNETATEAKSSRRVYYDSEERSYTSDGVPFTLEFEANITERGHQDTLYLNYTDRFGKMSTSEIGQTTYSSISDFLKQTTRATWENETAALDRVRERIPNIKEMFNGAVVGEVAEFKPNALAGLWSDFRVDIEEKFESLATSMTNEIRSKGRTQIDDNLDALVEGLIGEPYTAYRVVWYWFALHSVILISCVVFCIATIVLSRDVPVWKSHSLATMSQVPTVIDFGSEAKDLKGLEKRAKTIEVSLSKDEADGLLRQRNDRSRSSEDRSSEP